MIETKQVNEVIDQIKRELPGYHLPESLMLKFTNSKIDQEHKSYVEGGGGSYIRFLPLLIKHLNLKNILELGNKTGMSTLAIYDGLAKDSNFTTVDLEKDLHFCPDIMFKDKRVRFVFGDVSDLSIYTEIPYDVDLIFTDTVHNDSQLQDEWSIYQNLLADEALVAIDDINSNDKRRLFDSVDYSKWDLTDLCHVSGWGLFLFVRTEKISKEERLINAYKASMDIWRRKTKVAEEKLEKIDKSKIRNIVINILKRIKRKYYQ